MAAYYNEVDGFCCAWLRNLIKAKLIAPGDVDERDIRHVHPGDLAGYTQCHFFAGLGGWSYALRRSGWGDDSPAWSASCPCQPFSAAGKRLGDEDERHLWPPFFGIVREQKPVVLFGEQIASKDGEAWLDIVASDLESVGYSVGAVSTAAGGFGALNWRQRVYFVASMSDSDCVRLEGERSEAFGTWGEQQFERLVQDQLQFSVPSGRLRALVDGVSGRMGRLRAYGNAINSEQAAAFIAAFMECRP